MDLAGNRASGLDDSGFGNDREDGSEGGGPRGGLRSLRGLYREMKNREVFLTPPITPASPMGMGGLHKYKTLADQDSPGHAGRPGSG